LWWELYTLGRLHQASNEASAALGSAQRAASDLGLMERNLAQLEQHVDRLTLTTIALIELLRRATARSPDRMRRTSERPDNSPCDHRSIKDSQITPSTCH
jgi:hypothetical protein